MGSSFQAWDVMALILSEHAAEINDHCVKDRRINVVGMIIKTDRDA
jgi:hypothetical protein